ncbi:hypothetical protein HAHE_01710 [Haloferula helveola]|uniref:Uncharacterized protein n=2 Tax=Haloferula helveola TaxID=490095 RepID=A0ABM7RA52_9BACT|nr:hypothetical protein HAHE_01710 [Haloferula helveola]
MLLLSLLVVGMLSLSVVTLRSSSSAQNMAEAKANARMALSIAIGQLQREMGPDMRVSAESALLDSNEETEEIEGVSQSRWLASYDSWGGWLNDTYSPPDGSGSLTIQDTYAKGREPMFRRWLLSLPNDMAEDADAPLAAGSLDPDESVIMVGAGSLGDRADTEPDRVTRAYLVPVGDTGRQAWWIGPENHKAKVNLAHRPRDLSADGWEVAHGGTAEVGVGALPGFEALDDEPGLSDKLVSTQTMIPASVGEDEVKESFFDLTAHSEGVLASVRTGHLKKDLSLLFEQDASRLPEPYRFNSRSDVQEPSIRPMSEELAAKEAVIPNRHFQSWTNMRHFYRMYRDSSDATPTEQGVAGSLQWSRAKPSTDYATSTSMQQTNPRWDGSNHYWRAPVLAKLTLVYSLVAKPAERGKYYCRQYYSPVFTFWNPYNTQMVVPSGQMTISCKAYRMWPTNMAFHLNGQFKAKNGYAEAKNFTGRLKSSGRGDIVFEPGELKVFSMRSTIDSSTGGGLEVDLVPGFDPSVVAGDERTWTVGSGNNKTTTFSPSEKPGVSYEFSCAQWGGGVNVGNTPGAMFLESSLSGGSGKLPMTYSNDWLQRSPHRRDQTNTPITPPGESNLALWEFDGFPKIVAYTQMAIKGVFEFDYPSIDWERDWRCRNWIQAPPFYFGSGMYMSLDDSIAHTQRVDCPYIVNFGPTTTFGISKIIGQIGDKAFLGSGAPAYEQVTSAALLELPTAPVGSLAGFAGMRINPGWVRPNQYLKRGLSASDPLQLKPQQFTGNGSSVAKCSLYSSESKRVAYQSGVTGPGIGNSFMHPMLPRSDVYRFINNSVSRDVIDRTNPDVTEEVDTQAYCDYWDHVFLLNDALWDDYFVSSLADQNRPGASSALSLKENIGRLVANEEIGNSRYRYNDGGKTAAEVETELQAADGYLKAAEHLVVDGMFNVNSTSVDAWHAVFAGIRERKAVYRDRSGQLGEIEAPDGHIVVTRFNTEVSDKEMDDAGRGVVMPDGSSGWSGVRFLDDEQLRKLAEECVKQVKQRGPFLNFSEFINRRLSNDELGLMGALQSAIDYDDDSPESSSINYRFKNSPALMISASDVGRSSFSTPQAIEGSRLAGVPGYVIQSDLLKPIANTLSVRDDTFRIRAYGEALDSDGSVAARAWCEAIVQRVPEYADPTNDASEPVRLMSTDGAFRDNDALSDTNRKYGRKFVIEGFRWLHPDEV